MSIQNSINSMLGTVAAGAYAVNKTLESDAAQFTKEATEYQEHLENARSEAAAEQHKAETDMLNTGLELEDVKEVTGKITSVSPEEAKKLTGQDVLEKHMSDADAYRKSKITLQAKINQQREQTRDRLIHNSSIIDRAKNIKQTRAYAMANANARDQGGLK